MGKSEVVGWPYHAKGVQKGVSFFAGPALRRRKITSLNVGKRSFQEDELQFFQIRDVAEEGQRGRRGTVFLPAVSFVVGAGFIFATLFAVPGIPKNVLPVPVGLGAAFLLILLGIGFARRKPYGYWQVVPSKLEIEAAQDWQMMNDRHGRALAEFVRQQVRIKGRP